VTELSAKRQALVQYMLKGPAYEAHGYEVILANSNPAAYFATLIEQGIFAAHKNPPPIPAETTGFFHIPVWPGLKYLLEMSKLARSREDVDLAATVLQIVRSVTLYKDADGAHIDNYHTYSAFAEILGTLPSASSTVDDADLTKVWLESRFGNSGVVIALDQFALPNFLSTPASTDDNAKALRILQHCLLLRTHATKGQHDIVPVADINWLEKLLKHHAARLSIRTGMGSLAIMLAALRETFDDQGRDELSWLRRPAIEEHQQNNSYDQLENALVQSVRDGFGAWLQEGSSSGAVSAATALLHDASQIVRRIGIHLARTHWDLLRVSFLDALDAELFRSGHLHELYLLLAEHFASFSLEKQEQVIAIIEGLTDGLVGEERDRAVYRQHRWLAPLNGLNLDASIAAKVRGFGASDVVNDPHPDFLAYHGSFVGTGASPFSAEELIAFSRERTLIEHVDAYVPAETWYGETRKELIDTLSNAIFAEPSDFLWFLKDQPAASDRIYYGAIDGFVRVLQQESADVDLKVRVAELLTDFMTHLLCDPQFWEPTQSTEESQERFEPNRQWIPGRSIDAVKRIIENDLLSIDELRLKSLRQIIDFVLAHAEGLSEYPDDPMTATINNTRGKAVEALLQLALRRCRDADKSGAGHEAVWPDFANAADHELSRCIDAAFEVSTIFGEYLSQLLYASADWTTAALDMIFPEQHARNFACAVSGLGYANRTRQVYSVLQAQDIPLRALRCLYVQGSARERMIERIALAYMWGQETLDAPCLQEIRRPERTSDLAELLSTIAGWAKETTDTDMRDRAKALAKAATTIDFLDPATKQRVMSSVSRFIGYVTNPDESDLSWVLASTPYVQRGYYEQEFLDKVLQIFELNSEAALTIFTQYARNYKWSYDSSRIASLIRRFYDSGRHVEALQLLNQFIERGSDKDLFALYKELAP
jgi:hypothetical protein